MRKALFLYFLLLAALDLTNWQSTLNWLTPLALLLLKATLSCRAIALHGMKG